MLNYGMVGDVSQVLLHTHTHKRQWGDKSTTKKAKSIEGGKNTENICFLGVLETGLLLSLVIAIVILKDC